jgi:outer membrane receptor for ferrienterochelin and colicins
MEFQQKGQQITLTRRALFYENRWGGELQWKKIPRWNEVYGESIYTKRWELLGAYELPIAEKMLFSFSYTGPRPKLHLW